MTTGHRDAPSRLSASLYSERARDEGGAREALMRFEGRVVVLTGAAKGIGAVTAEAFAGERARVVALDLDGAGVDRVVAAVTARGGEIVGMKTDVTSSSAIQSALDAVLAHWGRVDILVNNAGG